ncbi:MAG: ATP-dependent Clp protease proteolytic subunit [Verrucomicrobiae bacterium]|nr:ATP-dependent Clp protease proteolytic subunit [Verrucomicrobiae bacterium]
MHEELSAVSPLLPAHLQQRVQPFTNVSVIEKEGGSLIQFDLLSRLMKDRIIFIGEQVSDPLANYVIAQMLYLQMQDPNKDINIYINSPGGSVTAGLAIYDTMQFVTCDVNTYCMGMAASMGAVLLAAGTKGKRYALPNSHVMIHQVSGGAQGTASDVERTVEFMYSLKKKLNKILSHHTGQPVERVEIDADRDNYMTAEAACEYGLIDKVLESNREVAAAAAAADEKK